MRRRAQPVGDGLVAAMAGPATAQEVPPGGTFYDDDGNVHEGAIEAIASRGVTLGCDADGTIYCVADSVTRDQMASFLAAPSTCPRYRGISSPTTRAASMKTTSTGWQRPESPRVSTMARRPEACGDPRADGELHRPGARP